MCNMSTAMFMLVLVTTSYLQTTTFANEAFVFRTPWTSYLRENIHRCLRRLLFRGTHWKYYAVKETLHFVSECQTQLTHFMCNGISSEDFEDASMNIMHTHHPCGRINLIIGKKSFSSQSQRVIFLFLKVAVPEALAINVSISHLQMRNQLQGTVCKYDQLSISENNNSYQDATWSSGYCGPAGDLYNYISTLSSLILKIDLEQRKVYKPRIIVGEYQVLVRESWNIFQSRSRLHRPQTGVMMSDYPFSRQLLSSTNPYIPTQYQWTYAMTVAVEPGYRVQANVSEVTAISRVKYVHLHDGPSKAYPLLYAASVENSTLNHPTPVDIDIILVSRGPRLYLELSLVSENTTNPIFSFIITTLPSIIVRDFEEIIVNESSGFHFECPYVSRLAQCIWKIVVPTSKQWMNMTIHNMDIISMNSLGCSKGILAVYDKSYISEKRTKIYETCVDFEHYLQKSVVSRTDTLWVILISYVEDLDDSVELEATLDLSNCQGLFNPLQIDNSHPDYPYSLEDNYFLVSLMHGLNVHVTNGCVVIQSRAAIAAPKYYARMYVDVPFFDVSIEFFQSSLAARCEQTFLMIGHKEVKLYPPNRDIDQDVFLKTRVMARNIMLHLVMYTIDASRYQIVCNEYDASFNIVVRGDCVNSSVFHENKPAIIDSIWSAYPEADARCGSISFRSATLDRGVGISHCETFKVPQSNTTTFLEFNQEFACRGLSKEWCSSGRLCSAIRLSWCSVILRVSFDAKCPEACIKSTKYAIKGKSGGKISLFSMPSVNGLLREISLSIPFSSLNEVLFVLYPVSGKQCHCDLTFQNYLYPHHWSTKDTIQSAVKWTEVQTGFFTYGKKKYIVEYNVSNTWEQAENRCKELHAGHIWTISDEDELFAVLEMYLALAVKVATIRPKYLELILTKVIYIGMKNNQWVDGSAATFSMWNTLSATNVIPTTHLSICNTRREYVLYDAKMSFHTEHFQNKYGYRSLQPQTTENNTCTAMYYTFMQEKPMWFTIPCNERIAFDELDLLCEVPLNTESTTRVSNESLPDAWMTQGTRFGSDGCVLEAFLLNGDCIRTLVASKELHQRPSDMCKGIGGSMLDAVITLDNSTALLAYVEALLQHSNTQVVVTFLSGGTCVALFPQSHPQLKYLPSEKWKLVPCSNTLIASHILCELKTPHTETIDMCMNNHFTCLDRSCIMTSYLCDGHSDCALSEDEADNQCQTVCNNSEPDQNLASKLQCKYNCTVGQCMCNQTTHFQCTQGGCIHFTLLCDHKVDCPYDDSDEVSCAKQSLINENAFTCHNGQTIILSHVCDGLQHCWDRSDEICTFNDNIAYFKCLHSPHRLTLRFLNDLRPDCPGTDVSDEQLYEAMLNGSVAMDYICSDPQKTMPCIPGHPHCVPHSKLCIYERSKDGEVLYCRNGEHLLGCDNIPCPYPYIKCHLSYCIPAYQICDGIMDCPDGDDEADCNSEMICPGMLKCKNASCVHMDNVCDGVVHCQGSADDEILCDFDKCPHRCFCVGPVYSCVNISLTSISSLPYSAIYLIIPNNNIALDFTTFERFNRLLVLNIAANGLKTLPRGTQSHSTFRKQTYLMSLNISNNEISSIESYTFVGLMKVVDLNLDGNRIATVKHFGFFGLSSLTVLTLHSHNLFSIESEGFAGLQALKEIDLSNNYLTSLGDNVLSQWTYLTKVNLQHNPLQHLSSSLFHYQVKIHRFIVGDADWCCHISVVHCQAPNNYSTSCRGILESHFHRIHVCILMLYCIIMNLAIVRRRARKQSNLNDFVMLNLAIADLFQGLYLAAIVTGDIYMTYIVKYVFTVDLWRLSPFCKIAMSFSGISCIVSNIVLVQRSANLLFAIRFPFKAYQMNCKPLMALILVLIWVVAIVLNLILATSQSQLQNSMCVLYFAIGGSEKHLIQALAFVCFMVLSQICVIALDYRSYRLIKASSEAAWKDHGTAKSPKWTLLPSCIGACCTCVKVVAILLLFMSDRVEQHVVILTGSWIISINSALCPILYNMRNGAMMEHTVNKLTGRR